MKHLGVVKSLLWCVSAFQIKNWNLVVLVFGARKKLDNLEKKLSEGASEITNNKLNLHYGVNAQ